MAIASLILLFVFLAPPAWAQLVPIGENLQFVPSPSPKETVCQNGLDDDRDGAIDCSDRDCQVYAPGVAPFGFYDHCRGEYDDSCIDEIDNDGDGLIDCQEWDCVQFGRRCGSPTPTFAFGEHCSDGVDNDGNGLADCNDPNCYYFGGQTRITGCPLTTLGDETSFFASEVVVCSDAYDNDHDGAADCADSDCAMACQTQSPLPPTTNANLMESAAIGTSVGLTILAAASAVVSLASAAAGAQSGPELLRSLLPFSAIHRRQAPWGRVVEAGSNKPIANAVLSLLDESGKVRATEKSRRDGTFGFFVPAGTYRIIAQHGRYQFPAPAPDIALFPGEAAYGGDWIQIQEESILALVVVGQEVSHTALATVFERLHGIWTRLQVWHARLAMPLLLVGGGLTLLSFWSRPSVLLALLLGVYIILFALELLLTRVARRAVGVVRDAITRGGVGLAVVRLLDRAGRLVATRVTLESGHFFLMPAPGKYRVEIVHRSYYPYVKEPLSVRKFFFGVAGVRARLTPK